MKSERKQTLESNLLADKIEEFAVQFKKAMPVFLSVVVVVALGLLAFGFYTTVKETQAAKGWTALYFADTDEADLSAISTDYGGTAAGLWAKQTSADANMSRALEKVYIDRDLAEDFYKKAQQAYQTVADKSTDSFLTGRANFGLAQAFEGLGDSTKALSHYRKVITNKAMGGELIAEATKRVAWLESKAGEEFYTWYKNNRPTSPVLNVNPPIKSTLPAAPNFDLPKDPQTETPTDTKSESAPPPSADGAKIELPNVDDIPAEKKPQS